MTTSADPGSTRGPDDTDADPGTLNPRSGAAARDESSGEYEDTDADPNNLNPRDLREGVSDDG
ncbi:MAG: hypothetical protein BGO38_10250 [Cellulomonas sp. 73-145]|uniref:hypothetical protein n=1 Tax=Cellulomonas sp. 73-145 TaxID=1895739 RepID=UPI00092A7306|nr:hypothetical protein [Cellulomonas sp. 73-145]MBN9327691.1 hypothetical protein [Cellulomonas sp.]OJV60589.1 MAG: hypothetical protein BGO38_10250 [Cellulomonas sp. 73-145]